MWLCHIAGMLGDKSRLGSAQVRWNDYEGTAAADDADAILNRRSLYEIAGLDRDHWMIVAVDFSMGASADPLVVYATRRSEGPQANAETDGVAVTAFHLGESVQLDQFLAEAFQRVTVRLLSSGIKGQDLVVGEHAQPDAG